MRSAVLILILAAGCASGDSQKNGVRVDVIEERGERITTPGQHAFTVRVTNMSPGQVEVESIHLAPAGITDFTFEDAMQTVGDVLSAGEARGYPMWVTIVAQGRPTSQFTSNLNSVSVTVACRSESGNFVDSEVVPIRPRR